MLFNVQSEFSFLQSSMNMTAYVSRAKEYGYEAIGIADEQSLFGVYQFVRACQQHQIKPLIGLKVTCSGMIRQDRQFSYLVYAKDFTGYQTLIQISKRLHKGFVSLLDILQEIKNKNHSVVWIHLGKKSEPEYLWFHQQKEDALKVVQMMGQYLDLDHYLGLSLIPQNPIETEEIQKMSQAWARPLVFVSQVYMLAKEDQATVQILQAIDTKDTLTIEDIQDMGVNYLYPFDEFASIHQNFGDGSVWLQTQQLVDQLNVEFPQPQHLLPKFATPNGMDAQEYLSHCAYKKLTMLEINQDQIYQDRLQHELSVIGQMGFSDYFLIIADILNYCRDQGIQTGPGRGSAPGSLVSYLLGITQVDPIKYDLLFERFLNPERYNMPDIDVDIPDNQRGRVLDYIKNKYGAQQTSQIVTFGTFGAKQALRDVLKVFGMDQSEISDWTKQILSKQNIPLDIQTSLENNRRFQRIVQTHPYGKKLIALAQTIEGCARHSSTHAGAVIISDFPIESLVPVMYKENQLQISQFSMYDVEHLGMLKMDFLGLRNLSVLADVLKGIRMTYTDTIDPFKIPLDDSQVFNLFRKAETQGVFQFESDGIKRVLRKVKPERFEDIVAVNALFRPGPMQQIDIFARRKNGKEAVAYIHDSLKGILQKTYGIIVYQEQVMQIVQKVAGFSLGQADILRRAMGKKDQRLMEQQKDSFIKGALAKGFERDLAEKIFSYIEEFSKYGFNRAHAVVYSYLAYQLAYLKVHYPDVFFAVILNQSGPKTQSFHVTLNEAKRILGALLPVDINQSLANFSVQEGRIRVGLASVMGIKMEFVRAILDQRDLSGPYSSLMDFLRRIPLKFLKASDILPLIQVGAFDMIDFNRTTLEKNLETLIQSVEFSGNNFSLFEEIVPKIESFAEMSAEDKQRQENSLLGFSMHTNHLERYQNHFQTQDILINYTDFSDFSIKSAVNILGQIVSLRIIRTKNDDLMAFVSLSDGLDEISIVVFPNVFNQCSELLKENQIILVSGFVELSQKQEKQVIARRIEKAQMTESDNSKAIPRCYIQLTDFIADADKIAWLKKYVISNPGPSQIILVDKDKNTILLDKPYMVAFNYRVQNELEIYFGTGHVVFQ